MPGGGGRAPQRQGKSRNARHHTRRSSGNKSVASLSVKPLGTQRVASIDAENAPPINPLSTSLDSQEGVRNVSDDRTKKGEIDSPSKLAQSVTELSVRSLLSRLPGSSTPSPQKVRPKGEGEDRKLSEERQSVALVALRLMQSQKEGKPSEKLSPTLSAVLTGCSVSEAAGKRREGEEEGGGGEEGNKDGRKEREEDGGCELTISIKLNSQVEGEDATPVNVDSSTASATNTPELESGDRGMGDRGMEPQLSGPEQQMSSENNRSTSERESSDIPGLDVNHTNSETETQPQIQAAGQLDTTVQLSDTTVQLSDTTVQLSSTGDVSFSQPEVSPPQPSSPATEATQSTPPPPTPKLELSKSSLSPLTANSSLSPHDAPPTPPPSAPFPCQTSLTGTEPVSLGDVRHNPPQNGVVSSSTSLFMSEEIPVADFSEAPPTQLETDCRTFPTVFNSDHSYLGVGVASAVEGVMEDEDVGQILSELCGNESIPLEFASSECLVVSVPDNAHHHTNMFPNNAHRHVDTVPNNAHHALLSLGGTRGSVFESHSSSNGDLHWFQNETQTSPTVAHIREPLTVKQNGHIDEEGVVVLETTGVQITQKIPLASHENEVYPENDSTMPPTKLPRPIKSLSLELVPSTLDPPPPTDTPTSLDAPDDGTSPPISELSSLTPDSAHFGPSSSIIQMSPVSSPLLLPSLPGPRWTPQRGEVTIRECRISLRPLGKEWTPSKKSLPEPEPLQPKQEAGKEAEKVEDEEEEEEEGLGEEIKVEGEGESGKKRTRGDVEEGPGLKPKKLRFTVVEGSGEKRDKIPGCVTFDDAQPIDQLVVDNTVPSDLPDLEIAQPEIIPGLPNTAENPTTEAIAVTVTAKATTNEHTKRGNIAESFPSASDAAKPGSDKLNRESEGENSGAEGLNGISSEGGEGLTGKSKGLNNETAESNRACTSVEPLSERGEIDEEPTPKVETRPGSSAEESNTMEYDVRGERVVPSLRPVPPTAMEVNPEEQETEANAGGETPPSPQMKYLGAGIESRENEGVELSGTECMENEEGESCEAEKTESKEEELGEGGCMAGNEVGIGEGDSTESLERKEAGIGGVLGEGAVDHCAQECPESSEAGGEEGRGVEERKGGREVDADGEKREGGGGREEDREGAGKQVHREQVGEVRGELVGNEEEKEEKVVVEVGREKEEEFGLLHLLAQVAVDSSPEVDNSRDIANKPAVRQIIDSSEGPLHNSEGSISSAEPIVKVGSQPKRAWRKRRNAGSKVENSGPLVTGGGGRGVGRGGRRRIRVWRSSKHTRGRGVTGRDQGKQSRKKLVRETNVLLVSSTEERGEVDVMDISCEKDGEGSEPAMSDVSHCSVKTDSSVERSSSGIVVVDDNMAASKAASNEAESICGENSEKDERIVTEASGEGANGDGLAKNESKEVENPEEKDVTKCADESANGCLKFEIPAPPQVDQSGTSGEPQAVVATQAHPPSVNVTSDSSAVGSEYTQSCDVINTSVREECASDTRSHDTGKRSHDMFVDNGGGEETHTDGAEPIKRVRVWRGEGRRGRRGRGRGRRGGWRGRGGTRIEPHSVESEIENVELDSASELKSVTESENIVGECDNETAEHDTSQSVGQTPQTPTPSANVPPDDPPVNTNNQDDLPDNTANQDDPPVNTANQDAPPDNTANLDSFPGEPSPSAVVSLPLSLVRLRHHQSLECYSTGQFQPGDVVWAKAPQLPGWPGLVINHSQWKRNKLKPAPQGKVRVFICVCL